MRQRMDDVFFELYGAKMVRDGMQKFEYRPHWPDMSEEGSRQRVEKLSAFKVELESASKTPQLLGDKNALSRMLYLVEERLRGEGIGGGALPVALAMDLFNQGVEAGDTPMSGGTGGLQVPFYFYPGIIQLLDFAHKQANVNLARKLDKDETENLLKGLQSFPRYLRQWSALLTASQSANVIPQRSNYMSWNYLGPVNWTKSFPDLKNQDLVRELQISLAEFQEKIRHFDPLIDQVYGSDQEYGYSILGSIGQEIFLWRLLGWGMNFTAEHASELAKSGREEAKHLTTEIVRGFEQALGQSMDVSDVLNLINNQSGPLYYQHVKFSDIVANLTLVYNNILKNTSKVFGLLSNCNTAVYSCSEAAQFSESLACGGTPFPAFGQNPPVFNEHGQCVSPQLIILGCSTACSENMTQGLACMDYLIPLMTCTMIHEGLGHWIQESQFSPPACDVDLPAVDTYQEGWGTYTETLGEELGQFDSSLWGQLSKVGLWMGAGLRISRYFLEHDVNYKNMTRSEAVVEWNTYPFASPTTYESNAMDFIIDTCQRSSYWPTSKIMKSQRNRAEKELGEKFDLPLFNHFMGSLQDQLTQALVEEAAQTFIDCSSAGNCWGP
ncbi:uncharacterized protein LOC108092009 [Durusdinium trenchii]